MLDVLPTIRDILTFSVRDCVEDAETEGHGSRLFILRCLYILTLVAMVIDTGKIPVSLEQVAHYDCLPLLPLACQSPNRK